MIQQSQILKPQVARVFTPLLAPSKRYLGAKGGRGSGKSQFFANLLVTTALANPGYKAICCREVQKSIKYSSKQNITDRINELGLLEYFEIQESLIKTPGGGIIVFQGLQDHTADSIKSFEGFDLAWVEEAQSVGMRSWRLLRPTIRKAGSQIWASWNPEKPTDPIDAFFSNKDDDDIVCVTANWRDNPWFAKDGVLKKERERDLRDLDPAEYQHIWEGAYLTRSESLIFRNNVLYEQEFDPPPTARFYFGMDWGFANDPTAIVRTWEEDKKLFIDYAEGKEGIELDNLPKLIEKVPSASEWPIRGDSARPEIISHLYRKGFNISSAKKWPGSVKDGIAHLKSYEQIVVHKRAEKIAQEFQTYAYKVDKRTEDILPEVEDKNNHWIDALRYALDGVITSSSFSSFFDYTDLLGGSENGKKPPVILDAVFLIIDTSINGTGVLFGGYTSTQPNNPLYILDWDLLEVTGLSITNVFPSLNERLNTFASKHFARARTIHISDKGAGKSIIPLLKAKGMPVLVIPEKMTSAGKEGRALAASPHVCDKKIIFSQHSVEKKSLFRASLVNHFERQIKNFIIDDPESLKRDDHLLTCFCYSILLYLDIVNWRT